jgi:hypothetical protein
MSKRHQASRRRSYGKRQHEVRERALRRHDHEILDARIDTFGMVGRIDALGMPIEPGRRRLGFAPAD